MSSEGIWGPGKDEGSESQTKEIIHSSFPSLTGLGQLSGKGSFLGRRSEGIYSLKVVRDPELGSGMFCLP